MSPATENTTWPDPTVAAANVYRRVLVENDRVRVLEARFKPGDVAKMHWHPDHVVYAIRGGVHRLSLPDGMSQDIPVETGQAVYLDAGPHEVQNIGPEETAMLVIELKG